MKLAVRITLTGEQRDVLPRPQHEGVARWAGLAARRHCSRRWRWPRGSRSASACRAAGVRFLSGSSSCGMPKGGETGMHLSLDEYARTNSRACGPGCSGTRQRSRSGPPSTGCQLAPSVDPPCSMAGNLISTAPASEDQTGQPDQRHRSGLWNGREGEIIEDASRLAVHAIVPGVQMELVEGGPA